MCLPYIKCASDQAPVDLMREIFGEPISVYTRKQAIADGVLVDLCAPQFTFRPNLQIVAEAGIGMPVAMTAAAFAKAVTQEGVALPPAQDLSGRLWDVLYMYKFRRVCGKETFLFKLHVWNWCERNGKRIEKAKHELVTLKAMHGFGDAGEPVVTILLPDED